MINLLTETEAALSENGKRPGDVQWVGSCDGLLLVDWDTFATLADFEYNDGFGSQEVANDLVIVGCDWWLERYEYDGSEGWEFKTIPIGRPSSRAFQTVSTGGQRLTAGAK